MEKAQDGHRMGEKCQSAKRAAKEITGSQERRRGSVEEHCKGIGGRSGPRQGECSVLYSICYMQKSVKTLGATRESPSARTSFS